MGVGVKLCEGVGVEVQLCVCVCVCVCVRVGGCGCGAGDTAFIDKSPLYSEFHIVSIL